MSRTARRILTVAMVLSLFATACSRIPPGGELAIVSLESDGAVAVLDGGAATDGARGDGVTSRPGDAASRPSARDTTSEGVAVRPPTDGVPSRTGGTDVGTGEDVGTTPGETPTNGAEPTPDDPNPTTRPTDETQPPPAGASGPGIDGNTIKIVFHDHFEDCPQQENEPSDAVREKGKKAIHEYVKFFNEYVLAPYGWQFEETIVDDGGFFCPERQRAAALEIAEEIKPFAALGPSSSAQGPIVADVVTRAGIIHAGTNWQFAAEKRDRHPYAWSIFASQDRAFEFFVGWLARRIMGTQVPDRTNGTGLMVDRVYGILAVDFPLGRRMAQFVRDGMEAAGMPVSGVYLISPDTGVASQQATSLVAKMKSDGINSLVFGVGVDGGNGAWNPAFTEAMNAQNYLPDVLVGAPVYGNAIFQQLNNKRVWENAKGTSSFPSIALRVAVEPSSNGSIQAQEEFDNINENQDAYIAAWNEKLGHSDHPQEGSFPTAFGTWSGLAFLAAGIIQAGDTLNAHTFASGLESVSAPNTPDRCLVDRFMGRDYRFTARYEWNAEHDGGIEGFTTMYWVNEPNNMSTGIWESYDNYLYFDEADQLAPEPSRDTGKEGYDIPKQERIGIRPWSDCSTFGDYPRYQPPG